MFYVYEHWRPDINLPFYVGKGNERRIKSKVRNNPWHKHIISKLSNIGLKVELNIVQTFENEQDAFNFEKLLIETLKNVGIELTNQTPGGEGGPTWLGKKHSEETKAKMSIKAKGNKGNLGRTFSEEHRKKLSLSQIGNKKSLGRKMTEDAKQKISAAQKGNKHSLGRKRSFQELEKCSKAMIAIHANKTPEERSDIIRRGHEKRKLNKLRISQYWGA